METAKPKEGMSQQPGMTSANNFRRPIRKIILGGLLILIAIWLFMPNTAAWEEEVQLFDGRVLRITQKRRYESAYNGHNYSPHIVREAWIRFNLPELGDREIEWHENLIAMRFDVIEGKPLIVAYPPTALEFEQYGKPQPAYLGFRYENGNWQRIGFKEIPTSQYDANLVIQSHVPRHARPLTLKLKDGKEFNGNPDISKCSKRIYLDPRCNYWGGRV